MVNISLDGRFLTVNVTPNPCLRHVCFMSMTKEIHVNRWVGMLLIGKNFANEGFYLSLFSVDRCIDSLYMNFVTYMYESPCV